MSDQPVEGISIAEDGDRVVIEVQGGRWEGSAVEAERLLTRLLYVIERARPGTNIASVFLNGQLSGGKFIETDRRAAVRDMKILVDQLANYVASAEEQTEGAD